MRCVTVIALALALALAGCPSTGDDVDDYEGDEAGECSDEADNDRDGLFDCDDEGCAGAPGCGDDDDSAPDDDDSAPDDDDTEPDDDDSAPDDDDTEPDDDDSAPDDDDTEPDDDDIEPDDDDIAPDDDDATPVIDSDGDSISDLDEGTGDTDGDGTLDALDTDSDDDGHSDTAEAGDLDISTPPWDTDGDGTPDFQDLDSDGDWLGDDYEVGCPGATERLVDDSDSDSFGDLAEVAVGSNPCDPYDDPFDFVENLFVVPYGGDLQTQTFWMQPSFSSVDVFLLTDVTGSMGGEVAELDSDLLGLLLALEPMASDMAWGAGRFADFPDSPWGVNGDEPFALLEGITTSPTQVSTASSGLIAGGGGDDPGSAAEALFQVADGSGVCGTGGCWGPFAQVGTIGGGRFRPGSLPVVVTITDAPIHDPALAAGGWDPFYPAGYSSHDLAAATAALQAIGARVLPVQSLTSNSNTTIESTAQAQLTDLALQTGAVAPVCAFMDSATTWQCGVDTCCGGAVASGDGCLLRSEIASDGAGLDDAITDSVNRLLSWTPVDVRAAPQDDGDSGTPDLSLLITAEAVPPVDGFRPAAEPQYSCWEFPVPAPLGGFGWDDGYTGFTAGLADAEDPGDGAWLAFQVTAQNTTIPHGPSPQLFEAQLQLVEQTTGLVMYSTWVTYVVPGAI